MAIKLGIIGAGNMGMAIVRGVIKAGVISPQTLVVADLDEDRRKTAAGMGCRTRADFDEVREAGQILLAVKPQGFADVAGVLGPLQHPTVVISIMAGLGSRAIREALGPLARMVLSI